jgi:hypothetical protein
LGFKRTKYFGEEKLGTWKREIESLSNMEKSLTKDKGSGKFVQFK